MNQTDGTLAETGCLLSTWMGNVFRDCLPEKYSSQNVPDSLMS